MNSMTATLPLLTADSEHLKKSSSWKGRLPGISKSQKKSHGGDDYRDMEQSEGQNHNEDQNMQFGVPIEDCLPSPNNEVSF